MHPALERLKRRRVVQWAIAYLAMAWVSIQLVDVLGGQFQWPLAAQQGTTWVLVVGFFVTLLTAGLHKGEREAGHFPQEGLGEIHSGTAHPGAQAGVEAVAGPDRDRTHFLGEGRAALARGAWHDAVESLAAADATEQLTGGKDLAGLAEAAWWTGDLHAATSARERAVAAYVEQGNLEEAGLLALQNAEDSAYMLADSVASGWMGRAERLLQGREDSVAYGHLLRLRSIKAMKQADYEAALTHAKQVHHIGARHGSLDLQALSIQDQGRILIALGQVEVGLPLVDEAMASAVSGELSLLTTGKIYCNMMETCEKLSDYERATQWNDVGTRWCEDHTESAFPGICRVYRAKILGLRGAWDEAEAEARRASEELKHWLPLAGEAWYQIGDLRLRTGDLPGAESAFHQAHELGREPLPGFAEVRWLMGYPDQARSLVDTALADTTLDGPTRARLLPLKVSISVGEGDLPAAQGALDELSQIVVQYPSPALSATVDEQRAVLALSAGRITDAIHSARSSVKRWSTVGFPYETARARLVLARAFLSAGDSAPAGLELRTARSAFERLGASARLEETDSLLSECGVPNKRLLLSPKT